MTCLPGHFITSFQSDSPKKCEKILLSLIYYPPLPPLISSKATQKRARKIFKNFIHRSDICRVEVLGVRFPRAALPPWSSGFPVVDFSSLIFHFSFSYSTYFDRLSTGLVTPFAPSYLSAPRGARYLIPDFFLTIFAGFLFSPLLF